MNRSATLTGETASDLPGDVTAPGTGTDASRRHFLRSQAIGLLTSARKLAGEHIGYADEVEACYGVRPRRFEEEEFEAAHRRLDEVVPGTGPLAERYVAWREAQAVPVDLLEAAIGSLAEDLQQRTRVLFGLPDGERVDFELVTHQPWGGFNYYLGGLKSKVAINVDLPVLSTRSPISWRTRPIPAITPSTPARRSGSSGAGRWWEESIALVGTPQNLIAEGLADLGLEVVMGSRPEPAVADHLRPLGSPTTPTSWQW